MEKQTTPTISLDERKKYVEQFPVFCLLTPSSLEKLVSLMEEIHIQPGEVVVHEGDYFEGFFLIISGEAEVSRSLKRIKKTTFRHIINLGPNTAIGLGSAGFPNRHGTRTATVIALTPMVVLHLDLFNFYCFLKEHGDIYPALKRMCIKFLLLNFLRNTKKSSSSIEELCAREESQTEDETFRRNQMIFNEINANNVIDDILKNELAGDEASLIRKKLKKLGFRDRDFMMS